MRNSRDALLFGCFLIATTFVSEIGRGPAMADTPALKPVDGGLVDRHFFERRIRPLLIEHCYECHSTEAGEANGGLRLDSAPAMTRGGTRGRVLVPGNLSASHLIRAVEYDDFDMQMPPDGKLAEQEIALLRRWVAGGAPDPRIEDTADEPDRLVSPLQRNIKSHWAFVVPERLGEIDWANLPDMDVANSADALDSNDAVDEVALRLSRQKNLEISKPVDRQTLHRRMKYDLHGMPSSWANRHDFANDSRPDAATRQLNRMLADPMYGERFGRHWLDVARYADTRGYATAGKNRNLKGSHRYRDWVISAFANDLAYDEMIQHQLAGDITDPKNASGNADAMGFLTVGRHFLRNDDTLDDRIDVIGRGLLGLTLACARCHDHKFDPIPTVDYYSLFNVLSNSVPPEDLDSAVSPLMLVDRKKLRDSRVYLRGNRNSQGDLAPRRYLTAFRASDEPVFTTGSGRFDLAHKIASATNPLTARVMVNRIWGHLMGRGIVDSASDFGFQTPRPELHLVLDELSADFAKHWSIQRLVRRLVSSRIYQQSSQVKAASLRIDPDNRLWTHANRKRRDFESMRDAILRGCDFCDTQVGGPSVEITEPRLTPRRTIYARIDRQNLPRLFRTFDFASPDMHSPKRYYTTVAQQSLFLLNHPQLSDAASRAADWARGHSFSIDQANASADRIANANAVEHLFISILGRLPTSSEVADALAFLSEPSEPSPLALDPRDLWRYGTGAWKDGQLETFDPFPVFGDNRWQAGADYPSKGKLGYASLLRDAGHSTAPGYAVVRRWVSPVSGVINVSGMVGHRNRNGDGIDAIIQIGGETVFHEVQKSNNRPLPKISRKALKGEAVDLIVLCREDPNSDSFFWRAKLSLVTAGGSRVEADSVNDFSGPYKSQANASLDRLAQLAQVMFLSNEFAFID